MRQKKYIWIILIISILWIFYYLYFAVADFRLTTPNIVFDKNDKIVWRIRTSDKKSIWNISKIDKNKIVNKILPILTSNNFVVFFSENSNKVWIENKEFWNEKKMQNIFSSIGKLKKEKSHCYSLYNWKLYFYKNKLFISDNKLIKNKYFSKLWNRIDLLADASKLDFLNDEFEDIYIDKNGSIKYISNKYKFQKLNQIEDEDMFAKEIPSNIESYSFFESKIALNHFKQGDNSFLAQLVDDGMVFFEWENDSFLLIDYNKSLDPIQFFQSNENLPIPENGIFRATYLGSFFTNGFYASKLNDKILLSKELSALNKVEMMYQTKNTLALNTELKNNIFSNLPKKVNERIYNKNEKYAKSYFNKTVLKIVDNLQNSIKSNNNSKDDFSYVDIGFEAEKILSNKDFIYVVGKQKLCCLKNKKVIWQKEIIPSTSNQIINYSFLQDFGNNFLLINYSNYIDIFNSNGERVSQIVLPSNQEGQFSTYYWSGNNYILYYTSDKILHNVDFKGNNKNFSINETSKFKNSKIILDNGQLIAVLLFEKNIVEFNLTTGKTIKKTDKIISDIFYLKNKYSYNYFELKNDGIYNSNKKLIQSSYFNNPLQYRFASSSFLTVQDSKNVYLIDNNSIIKQNHFNGEEIDSYFCFFEKEKLSYIAVLDGIHNKISILNVIKNKINQKKFDNSKAFSLIKSENKLVLLSSVGKLLLFYPIEE